MSINSFNFSVKKCWGLLVNLWQSSLCLGLTFCSLYFIIFWILIFGFLHNLYLSSFLLQIWFLFLLILPFEILFAFIISVFAISKLKFLSFSFGLILFDKKFLSFWFKFSSFSSFIIKSKIFSSFKSELLLFSPGLQLKLYLTEFLKI